MKNRFRMGALVAAVLLVTAGAAIAAVAKTPPGEPTIPGVEYASGLGAPYLSTAGAPRKLSGAGIGPLTGPLHAAAVKAGTAAGKKAGKGKKLHLKVGYLDIIGGIESADRADNSMRNAFKDIGSSWVYCDGAGTPTKWVQCGNSLLAQGVDVIALTGIDPSTMPSVVSAAKAKNVPIVDCCGTVGPGFAGQFAPNETKNGKILAEYLKAKLASQSGQSSVISIDYPAPWATQRTDQLKAMVSANSSKLKITSDLKSDPTNLIEGTKKQVSDALTADPKARAIWVAFDTAGQAAAQVIQSKYAGKKFPDKPLLVTFHADPSTQPLIKSGAIDAVVDNNYDGTAWEMVDAVAQHFAKGKPFPAYGTSFSYPGLGDPMAYSIVTGANLPPANHYVAPKVDTVGYFMAKWKAQGFGK
jgi:ABC-type sugar transport system substrate-binding protein